MSDGQRINVSEARRKAESVCALLKDTCKQIEIAGSVRRGKPDVGDVEIVVRPSDAPTLLARIDMLVVNGTIYKARYSNGTTRWGERYRGLIYEGLRIEVFVADEHNWGYIYWLRTGPGDANEWVMRECMYQRAPYRANSGYWWTDGKKIHIPDEAEMFRLLGINAVLTPEGRTLAAYQKLMARVTWAQQVAVVEDEPIPSTQMSMF